MESEEVFLGFHSTARTDSGTLLSLVKTSLMSFDLPISGISGQAYDGAANMAGRENGFQAKLIKVVKGWVNSLAVSLSAEGGNLANAECLYDCVKFSALDTLQLDLSALPRANRASRGARYTDRGTDSGILCQYLSRCYDHRCEVNY